jgi:hypothetical protein
VHYRYHPLCGRDVRVVRRYQDDWTQGVIVLLPDATRCALPSWMLDEVFCAGLAEADHPRVAITALCALGKLLDDALDVMAESVDESKLLPRKKESQPSSRGGSVDIAADYHSERSVCPKSTSPTMFGTVGRAAQCSSSRRRQSRRRSQQ